MTHIVSYISRTLFQNEFARDIRDRHLDQKFLYTDPESALQYYRVLEEKKKKMATQDFTGDEYFTFLKDRLTKDERIAIISLGCGNSEREKKILKELKENGYDFIYVAVDSSHPMLEMSEKELADLSIEKWFIEMDMTDNSFKDKIVELTKDYPKRIFSFLGGTLGNVNQTNIADVLYNILSHGDLLWLEVGARLDMTTESDLRLFNRYASYLQNDQVMSFYFHPLAKIGVPYDTGKMNLKTQQERSVGALLFTYYFTFGKKFVIELDRETIHFLPNEEIELQNNRVYHPETLISFFEEHEFAGVNRQTKGGWEQILLLKK